MMHPIMNGKGPMGRGMCGMMGSMKGPWSLMGMGVWDDWLDDDDMSEDDMTNRAQMRNTMSWLLSRKRRRGGKGGQCLISSIFGCVAEAGWTEEPEGKMCRAMGPEVLGKWTNFVENVIDGKGFPLPTDCMRMGVLHKSFANASRATIEKLQLKR